MASKQMTESVLYFYKGTAWPQYNPIPVKETMDIGKEMIVLGLKDGLSLEAQAEIYKSQLDLIEGIMVKYANPTTEKGMNKVASILNKDLDSIGSMWIANVCALLHLKKIQNDDMNGYYIQYEW
tara:strand:- start:193 stop:564 length:372 start_codon:yes stop_codon:yes gene_type:complete